VHSCPRYVCGYVLVCICTCPSYVCVCACVYMDPKYVYVCTSVSFRWFHSAFSRSWCTTAQGMCVSMYLCVYVPQGMSVYVLVCICTWCTAAQGICVGMYLCVYVPQGMSVCILVSLLGGSYTYIQTHINTQFKEPSRYFPPPQEFFQANSDEELARRLHCMCLHTYTHTHTYAHIYIHKNTHNLHTYIYAYTQTYINTHIHTQFKEPSRYFPPPQDFFPQNSDEKLARRLHCIYLHTYTHTHTHTRTYTYINTHTHTVQRAQPLLSATTRVFPGKFRRGAGTEVAGRMEQRN
jgi:hypothetical protein